MHSSFRPFVDESWDNYGCYLLLATFVRQRRQQLRMSVSYAAYLAGIQTAQWAALETGWVPERGSTQLHSIAGTLKVNTESLLQLATISRVEAA
jgi:hypothetical protein